MSRVELPDEMDHPVTFTDYGVMTDEGEVGAGFLDPKLPLMMVVGRDDLTLVTREVTVTPWRTMPKPKQSNRFPGD